MKMNVNESKKMIEEARKPLMDGISSGAIDAYILILAKNEDETYYYRSSYNGTRGLLKSMLDDVHSDVEEKRRG